jgi:2-polyprenyl-3-methyl-5-hydroxy-6-metoxy-1,4-benzoquinol methylase
MKIPVFFVILKNIILNNIGRLKSNSEVISKSNDEVFNLIYQNKLWGKNLNAKIFSGPGSYNEKLISQWIDNLASFITKLDVKTVSDIGCGDFNVSSALLDRVNIASYAGYDVSDHVIKENKIFESESIEFKKLDITREPQKTSDLVIVREVFQHLSNKDIKLSLQNILKSESKNIIVGLSQPRKYLFKNIDMPTGKYTRLALYHAYLDLNNYSNDIHFELVHSVAVNKYSNFNIYFARVD